MLKDRLLLLLMDVSCKTPLLRGRFYQWVGEQWSKECDRLEARLCARRGHAAEQWGEIRTCRNCHSVLKPTDPVAALTLNIHIP